MAKKRLHKVFSVHSRPDWAIKESEATPQSAYINRRQWIRGAIDIGAIAGVGAAGFFSMGDAQAQRKQDELTDLKATPNNAYPANRPITPEEANAEFNNFYEFGSHKSIFNTIDKFEPRPWEVIIDGLVDNPIRMDIDDFIAKFDLEERVYRHRCVEAWSMTVPWTGFAMAKLVRLVQPQSNAKFIRFEGFNNPRQASGIRNQSWLPWPYVEGLTLEEGMNELAMMVVGDYGKILKRQHGAPLRIAVPWKYGFKHIKSVRRISFTSDQPKSFWETLAPSEYGFWANVNPQVHHPRWRQDTERLLHTNERIPTQIYNGYGAQVAKLYANMKLPDTILYR